MGQKPGPGRPIERRRCRTGQDHRSGQAELDASSSQTLGGCVSSLVGDSPSLQGGECHCLIAYRHSLRHGMPPVFSVSDAIGGRALSG